MSGSRGPVESGCAVLTTSFLSSIFPHCPSSPLSWGHSVGHQVSDSASGESGSLHAPWEISPICPRHTEARRGFHFRMTDVGLKEEKKYARNFSGRIYLHVKHFTATKRKFRACGNGEVEGLADSSPGFHMHHPCHASLWPFPGLWLLFAVLLLFPSTLALESPCMYVAPGVSLRRICSSTLSLGCGPFRAPGTCPPHPSLCPLKPAPLPVSLDFVSLFLLDETSPCFLPLHFPSCLCLGLRPWLEPVLLTQSLYLNPFSTWPWHSGSWACHRAGSSRIPPDLGWFVGRCSFALTFSTYSPFCLGSSLSLNLHFSLPVVHCSAISYHGSGLSCLFLSCCCLLPIWQVWLSKGLFSRDFIRQPAISYPSMGESSVVQELKRKMWMVQGDALLLSDSAGMWHH